MSRKCRPVKLYKILPLIFVTVKTAQTPGFYKGLSGFYLYLPLTGCSPYAMIIYAVFIEVKVMKRKLGFSISAMLLLVLFIFPSGFALYAAPAQEPAPADDPYAMTFPFDGVESSPPAEGSQKWTSPLAVVILIVMIVLALLLVYFKVQNIRRRNRRYSRTYRD